MRFQFDPRTDDPRPLAERHEELAARMYGVSVEAYRAQKAKAEAALARQVARTPDLDEECCGYCAACCMRHHIDRDCPAPRRPSAYDHPDYL